MRKLSIKKMVATGASIAVLGGAAFAFAAGSASAATPPVEAPPVGIAQVEAISSQHYGAWNPQNLGTISTFTLKVTSKTSTWELNYQGSKYVDTFKYDANTGARLYLKSNPSKKSVLRQVVEDGYAMPNTLPLAVVDQLATDAAGGGYLRDGKLNVNVKNRSLEWKVVVEQGKKDKTVVVDVKTATVLSVK